MTALLFLLVTVGSGTSVSWLQGVTNTNITVSFMLSYIYYQLAGLSLTAVGLFICLFYYTFSAAQVV
jgi:hypothetical protein